MRNILVADDHQITRRGILELLREAFDGVEVGEASDSTGTLALLPTRAWDLLILDIMMPGIGILPLIGRIRALGVAAPILVLTSATEVEYVVQALRAGANGLIHKHRAADEIVGAIERVIDGGTYLHPDTAAAVATALREQATEPVHLKLSAREMDIFRRIALGQAVKEIAIDLSLSDKTVTTYLARIREKTGLASHVEIARYAMRHRIVE